MDSKHRPGNEVLPASEGPFHALAENATDAIVTIDAENRIRFVNAAAQRIFGYDREALLGEPFAKLIPEPLRERHRAAMERYMATGERRMSWNGIELPGLHASGRRITLEVSFSEFTTSGKRYFTGIMRDITDWKTMQRRRAVQRVVTDVLAQSPSLEQATMEILAGTCEALGWSAGVLWQVDPGAEFLRPVATWFDPRLDTSDFPAVTRATTLQSGAGLAGRAWARKEPVWFPDVTVEPSFPQPEAAARAGLHTAFAFPILFGNDVLGVMAFFDHEIQEPDQELLELLANVGVQVGQFVRRVQAEATIREREEHYRFALESAETGTWELDPATGEEVWSDILFELYGVAPRHVTPSYRAWLEHLHPEDRERADASTRDILRKGGTSFSDEFRILHPRKGTRWVLTRGRVTYGEDGAPIRMMGTVVDITERKQLEMRDRFLLGLNTALQSLEDPDEIMRTAARMLGEHLGADRCAYAEVEADEDRFVITGDYVRGDMPHATGRFRLGAFGAEAARLLREGHPYVVHDAYADERVTEVYRAAYERMAFRAAITVPLRKAERLVARMAVHQWAPRDWSPEEVELVATVANRCWEALERARVTRELRESEARYRTVLTSIDQGYTVIEVLFDEDGTPTDYRFLEVNPIFEELTGLQQAMGKRARELVPDLEQQWFDIYGRVALTGEPIRFEQPSEAMGRWFDLYAFRLGGQESRKVAVLFTNITERKRAEAERETLLKALELERSRLSTVFRQAPAAIATLRGPEHVFEMANPRYYQLVGHRDIIGKPVREALPEVVDQGFVELLDEVYGSGEPFLGGGVRILLQREPGDATYERYVDFVYQPLRDADGDVEGIFAHAVDVTEHKRVAEELARAHKEMEGRVEERTAELKALNAELEAFNYSVSHDLRAPLRGIGGFSQALLEDYGEALDDTARRYLQRIETSTARMGDLIDDLLELSRLSRARLVPREVDLGDLARSVVEELREREPEREVDVEIQDGMEAFGDAALLRIALENLVGNAFKFTRNRARGRIEVGTLDHDGEEVYFVRDDGAGFAMQYKDKLFAPFQRLHSGNEFEGVGVGLATVQRIIHRHGGRIWAEGEPGVGATFYFTLAP